MLEVQYIMQGLLTGIIASIQKSHSLSTMINLVIERIKNRIARRFSIYFQEIKDIYNHPDTLSGVIIAKVASPPCYAKKLGITVLKQIWRNSKLRNSRTNRVTALVLPQNTALEANRCHKTPRKKLETC